MVTGTKVVAVRTGCANIVGVLDAVGVPVGNTTLTTTVSVGINVCVHVCIHVCVNVGIYIGVHVVIDVDGSSSTGHTSPIAHHKVPKT